VQGLQQQRESKETESGTGEAGGRELSMVEVDSLLDANTEFVNELRQNFASLSTVVEDLLHRQVALASEL